MLGETTSFRQYLCYLNRTFYISMNNINMPEMNLKALVLLPPHILTFSFVDVLDLEEA